MTRETETAQSPRRYQIPTHLKVPDKIGVSFLGLGVEVTIRQGLICLLGGAVAFHLWHALAWLSLYGSIGGTLRLLLPGVTTVLALLIALLRIADRSAETWLAILLNYALQPKVYLWKSIIHDPTYRLHEGDEGGQEMESQEEEVEEC